MTVATVYAIQSDASHDNASVRARNLFWRVWSCPRLAHSISSTTLMTLLRRVGQDFELDPIGDTIQLPHLRSQQVSHNDSVGLLVFGAKFRPRSPPIPMCPLLKRHCYLQHPVQIEIRGLPCKISGSLLPVLPRNNNRNSSSRVVSYRHNPRRLANSLTILPVPLRTPLRNRALDLH